LIGNKIRLVTNLPERMSARRVATCQMMLAIHVYVTTITSTGMTRITVNMYISNHCPNVGLSMWFLWHQKAFLFKPTSRNCWRKKTWYF